MNLQNRTALAALALAGALWGLTVPLSKLALVWMSPGWLAVARFAVAAPLLALAGRRGLRDALRWPVVTSGAVGFGAVIVLQNVGIEHTSVSHAALVVGAVPVLVALIGAGLGGAIGRPVAWGGYLLALVGIGFTAGSGGSGATAAGDLLVFGSAVLSAAFIVVQPRLLARRDPAAVTAVQFAAGALLSLPYAVLSAGMPSAPAAVTPVLAFVLLAVVGTVAPFWLFAFGQSRVPVELAGAFVNLEPVVGATVGWVAFGNAAAVTQIMGAVAVLGGIALSAGSSGPPAANPSRGRGWTTRRPRAAILHRGDDLHRRAACPDGGGKRRATASSPRQFLRNARSPDRDRLRRRAAHDAGAAGPIAGRARLGSPQGAPHRRPESGPRPPLGF